MGKGFKTFMENSYWRRIYENAPGEQLKEYYRIIFDISPFVMGAGYRNEEAERKLADLILYKSDIQYIRQNSENAMARQYYDRFLQKLSGEYESYGFPASFFQAEVWNPGCHANLNPD